ncbi:MAG: TIGR03987 family protein [Thermomicrobiales bacterium]|nr:TIGR03987 family protein [Thermomicrobiales bacterium]
MSTKGMFGMLTFAIVTITLALILYTTGVWAERFSGRLRPWHLVFFYGGLVFDTLGTQRMSELAGSGFNLNLHAVTGLIALMLMAAHTLWATMTVIRNQEPALVSFGRLSTAVWAIWLIPYVTGLVMNTGRPA